MKITRYVRYRADDETRYGILEGETIHDLRGNIFADAVLGVDEL